MEHEQENKQQNMQINTGLVCLDIVAKLNQINFDAYAVVREFAIESADISQEELVRIAKNAKTTKNIITGICKLCAIMFNPEVNISLPGIVVDTI